MPYSYFSRNRIMLCKMTQTQADLLDSALESLPLFIEMFDADWEMVCDFIESQCGDLPDYAWDQVEQVYNR